jgi:hypothetical protein
VSELEPLSDSVLFLFKGIIAPLRRLLQADISFVNLSDNPEIFEMSETFFRMDCVLMMDLDSVVSWFTAFAVFAGPVLTNDNEVWELFQVVVAQKGALELYGNILLPLLKILQELRGPKRLKKGETNFLVPFEKIDFEKSLHSCGYRRRSFAMVICEALDATKTDRKRKTSFRSSSPSWWRCLGGRITRLRPN